MAPAPNATASNQASHRPKLGKALAVVNQLNIKLIASDVFSPKV